MLNEIIALLPSADLKAKIKEVNHQFKEEELLQIIRLYAPDFDSRLSLLERYAQIASPLVADLASAYVAEEKESFKHFSEPTEGCIYELRIQETPDSFDERYLCDTFDGALACIDRFYMEYAEVDAKETDLTRYQIYKRKIFSKKELIGSENSDLLAEEGYGICVLGKNKTVLEVSDYSKDFGDAIKEGDEKKDIELEDPRFPCFVPHRGLIKYSEYGGKEHYGVHLCWRKEDPRDGLADDYYVIPLDSFAICEHRFEEHFNAHTHIAAPLITLAKEEDLDEIMRKNYQNFLAFLDGEKI